MPLIECFLTVCGSTSLRVPALVVDSKEKEKDNDRRKTLDLASPEPSSSSRKRKVATLDTDVKASEGAEAPVESESTISAGAIAAAVRDLSGSVPGARFRNNTGYLQMQLELDDSSPTGPLLLKFVDRNRVLLNMVLRHNVHLLESSFSALVTVPRCRHLLHFDIKRAFFKMKLKRMRQTSARSMHGSLRISVRRQNVFDDSFQSFRYKTADEMRRRLSVTFHGEEGMDAGGLTREWYSVLAREIFNANYALFTATSDSVTFQPNKTSYINPEHLSYFKFVGRVIGKAICDGQLLDAHFTRSFYKHMLGQLHF